MKKRILSIVAGLITGFVLISAGDYLLHLLYPLPAGIDLQDKSQLILAMSKMPVNAFILLLCVYAAAALGVGMVTTIISKSNIPPTGDGGSNALPAEAAPWRPAIICGLVFTIGGIINASALAHPMWFVMANVIIYLPFTYIGYALVKKRTL